MVMPIEGDFNRFGKEVAEKPSQEKIDLLKASLTRFVLNELREKKDFTEIELMEMIENTMPEVDSVLLGTRLKIFKDDIIHFAKNIEIFKKSGDENAYTHAIEKKIVSEIDFLLANQ